MGNLDTVDRQKGRKFLTALKQLCRDHGISISHEDQHGAFLLVPYNKCDEEWLENADYYRYQSKESEDA